MPNEPYAPSAIQPHYRLRHVGGSIALGIVGVAGLIGQVAGPLPGISPETWRWITFIALAIATAVKASQSRAGADKVAPPKA